MSCPQPGCLREPFDTPLGGGWKKRSSSGGIIDVSGGVFRSQVEGGNAYLARPLSARTRARLSVAVVVDQKPKDGTSLAKIVDGNSKGEVNIQFDGGDVRACVVLAGTPGPPQCTTPRALPGGLEVHLGLEGAGGVSYDDLDLTPVF